MIHRDSALLISAQRSAIREPDIYSFPLISHLLSILADETEMACMYINTPSCSG